MSNHDPHHNLQWQLWFAWYPVYADDDWYWFCDMMRAQTPHGTLYRTPTRADQQQYIREHRARHRH